MVDVRLVEVDADNWRACVALRVDEEQRRWVADVAYYLCLCAYGGTWHPLAIQRENDVVGFLMWGVDDDYSRWIGGLIVDTAHQRHGVGPAAVIEEIRMLIAQPGGAGIAQLPPGQPCRPLHLRRTRLLRHRRDRRRWL